MCGIYSMYDAVRKGQQSSLSSNLQTCTGKRLPIRCLLALVAAQDLQESPVLSWCVHQADLVGWGPLHWAASRGNAGALKILIEFGADVNRGTPDGFTPSHGDVRSYATPRLLVSHDVIISSFLSLSHSRNLACLLALLSLPALLSLSNSLLSPLSLPLHLRATPPRLLAPIALACLNSDLREKQSTVISVSPFQYCNLLITSTPNALHQHRSHFVFRSLLSSSFRRCADRPGRVSSSARDSRCVLQNAKSPTIAVQFVPATQQHGASNNVFACTACS
eukprot:1798657-Rhodomonas_salina.2